MDILLVFVVIAIHYVSDYMSKNPEYKCPEYCEVDHEHLPIKKEDPYVSSSSNKNNQGK